MTGEFPDFNMVDPFEEDGSFVKCPACGEWMDFCLGHGEIGDPVGFAILEDHDNGDHSRCYPAGCDESTLNRRQRTP